MTDETTGWTGGQRAFGDFAPALVHYTDRVLFDEVWERPELSKRDRSLITVAALLAGGNAEQLNFHLDYARKNGLTEQELIEAVTHLAFYAGWPKAMSAMAVAKKVFAAETAQEN
ncbi:carboxymuconolactone decarboxylase family protein [Arthrobacter sp. NPDC057013]|uniref:carboxymuconolactone decarboxylase family protein n=1 Tax=Arthrobacter sp. NPDC057013 TaxID=3345999 RepID=UPI003637C4FD